MPADLLNLLVGYHTVEVKREGKSQEDYYNVIEISTEFKEESVAAWRGSRQNADENNNILDWSHFTKNAILEAFLRNGW